MPVSFASLRVGEQYERPYLAKLWGYAGFQAISRGVVTPAGTPYIILFVTEKKQESLTQYADFLERDRLHWEGEKKHGSDARIIAAGFGPDQIYLFHRLVHHTPFTYLGRVLLEQHSVRTTEPSQFIFYLTSFGDKYSNTADDGIDETEDIPTEQATERAAIRASRIGQGVFRDGLIRLWQGCAVSRYDRAEVLVASHIKPWKDANDRERLDPYNGLLLQPTIDKLFDIGLITFDPAGLIVKAPRMQSSEFSILGIPDNSRLTSVPDKTAEYLQHHREFCFDQRRRAQ